MTGRQILGAALIALPFVAIGVFGIVGMARSMGWKPAALILGGVAVVSFMFWAGYKLLGIQ